MRKQSGFTLVELMVVMAIIAILATAGISQYGRFIKGARDTTRVADLQAINVVLLDSIQSTGLVPDTVEKLKTQMEEAAGKVIVDKITGDACLGATKSDVVTCAYQYAVCDGGTGYVLATSFESPNNITKYTKDDIGGDYSARPDLYEIGTCNTIDGTMNPITNT